MEPRYDGHIGKIFLISLVFISALILIPMNLVIIYYYYKNKSNLSAKTANFKTGLCYFVITLLFYINFCFRLLNECYGDISYGYIFVCTTALFYGLHFMLLIYLLFCRIYYVFNNTQYKLSKLTLYTFVGLCIFCLSDVGAFTFVVFYTNDDSHILIFILYSIGVITIILITIWITLLYIYKLFRLIRNNSSMTPQNDKLIANVTKYTILAIIWISTGIIFWFAPFIALYGMDYLKYLILYHTFILLDVSANNIAFVLGYHFADKIYLKCCNKLDKIFRKCLEGLVNFTRQNEINLSKYVDDNVEISPYRNRAPTSSDTTQPSV